MKSSAILNIFEKVKEGNKRQRRVRVTADSVTIGCVDTADIELKVFQSKFLVEVKFSDSRWWLLNPMRAEGVRLNGKPVALDAPLSHQDQIIVDEHMIVFEQELSASDEAKAYEFLPPPATDQALWNYLLREDEFDEIMINGSDQIFVDYKGNLLLSPYRFQSTDFLIKRVFHYTKKKEGWASWRLNRNLRIQAALPPTVEAPHICIRKARKHVFSLGELENRDFINDEQHSFLQNAVQNKESIIITGATSTGKTVLMRSLVEQVPGAERLVIVEEEAETDWPHEHVVAIE